MSADKRKIVHGHAPVVQLSIYEKLVNAVYRVQYSDTEYNSRLEYDRALVEEFKKVLDPVLKKEDRV